MSKKSIQKNIVFFCEPFSKHWTRKLSHENDFIITDYLGKGNIIRSNFHMRKHNMPCYVNDKHTNYTRYIWKNTSSNIVDIQNIMELRDNGLVICTKKYDFVGDGRRFILN